MDVRGRIVGMLIAVVVASGTAIVPSGTADAEGSGLKFKAALSGAQEVTGTVPPGVVTATSGKIDLVFDDALSVAQFELVVNNGVGIVAAHLHCGRAGTNGPVVVPLFGAPSPGIDVDGELASGTLTNADVTGADCVPVIGVPINNMASLALAARKGLVYANVHTVANPAGEIRGQLLED